MNEVPRSTSIARLMTTESNSGQTYPYFVDIGLFVPKLLVGLLTLIRVICGLIQHFLAVKEMDEIFIGYN